ncbi:MAG: stalk domain-containing protein [Caldisericaceae bacterium]
MRKKRIILLLLIVVALVLNVSPTKGDNQNQWKKPIGVYGGEIDTIKFSPNFSSDKTIFAAGPEGLYSSNDGGENWNILNYTGGEGATTIALSRNFATDNTLIAGSKAGLYISKDSGKTWTSFQKGLSSTYITKVDTDASGNFFALTFDGFFSEIKPQDTQWSTVNTFDKLFPTTFTVDGNLAYVGCEMGTIYKVNLTDKSFETLASNLSEGAISAIAVYKNQIVASSYDDGLFISDNGKDFSHELKGTGISDLAIANDGTIVALEAYGGLEVKRGSVFEELPSSVHSTNISLSLYPDFTKSNSALIASFEYGVIKASNLSSFALANTGITNVNVSCIDFSKNYASNHTAYLGTVLNGLYISKDGCKSFTNTSNMTDHQISQVKELSNGTISVGTFGEGIWNSVDNAKSFTQADILKNDSISFIEEASSSVVVIGTKDDGLYITDINFKTASKVKDLWSIDTNISGLKTSGNTIIAGTSGGSLYLSSDNGNSFKEIANNVFSGLAITGLALSPGYQSDGTILVGTASGEFISRDRGAHFSPVYDLGTTWADGCAFSPNFATDGTAVVGAWGYVYVTNNNFGSFSNQYYNISNRYITQVSLTPDFNANKSGLMIALTSSGGIFTLSQTSPTVVKMTVGQTGMLVNGKYVATDAAPVIKNSRTLVPIRFVSDALGAKVAWSDSEKKVTITLNNHEIVLYIGKSTAFVDGNSVQIDSTNPSVVPEIIGSRTYVPIRFVSESFKATVAWDNISKQVTITLGGDQ